MMTTLVGCLRGAHGGAGCSTVRLSLRRRLSRRRSRCRRARRPTSRRSRTTARSRIAYMPPATEFNYYIAIGEGIKAAAAEAGVEIFMLAPQSGADINGQMGMIQDVITQGVDAIILSTHDEAAAAPLVKKAVDAGIAVIIVNSDIANFPTPVHGVVGYSQRTGTHKIGDYLLEKLGGKPAKVGVIEGLPGYHSTERVGGFLDAVKDKPGIEIVASIPGGWNVEGGNTAGMDLLQAHPDDQRRLRRQRLHDHGRGAGREVARQEPT